MVEKINSSQQIRVDEWIKKAKMEEEIIKKTRPQTDIDNVVRKVNSSKITKK